MKKACTFALLVLVLVAPAAGAAESEAVGKAQDAAGAWLALVDAGKYGESWEAAASFFKAAVTKPGWESAVRSARSPFGALKSRKLKSATFKTSLPGAPDGEYVMIQYDTRFEKKEAAVETVTPMREKDGSWKVSGYFVR
jgi:hypothetical protein